jgi:hypothetical protein
MIDHSMVKTGVCIGGRSGGVRTPLFAGDYLFLVYFGGEFRPSGRLESDDLFLGGPSLEVPSKFGPPPSQNPVHTPAKFVIFYMKHSAEYTIGHNKVYLCKYHLY